MGWSKKSTRGKEHTRVSEVLSIFCNTGGSNRGVPFIEPKTVHILYIYCISQYNVKEVIIGSILGG